MISFSFLLKNKGTLCEYTSRVLKLGSLLALKAVQLAMLSRGTCIGVVSSLYRSQSCRVIWLFCRQLTFLNPFLSGLSEGLSKGYSQNSMTYSITPQDQMSASLPSYPFFAWMISGAARNSGSSVLTFSTRRMTQPLKLTSTLGLKVVLAKFSVTYGCWITFKKCDMISVSDCWYRQQKTFFSTLIRKFGDAQTEKRDGGLYHDSPV